MIKVVAKMSIAPENKDAAGALIEELVAATVQEEGCINYNFCQEAGSDNSYAILETWEGMAALGAHEKSEHFTRLIPRIAECVSGEISIEVFEVLF